MTISDLYTPVLTLLGIAITAFFSSEGWKYYQKKLERKHKDEEFKRQEEHLYREDLRARVSNLEAILTESMKRVSVFSFPFERFLANSTIADLLT